MTANIALCVLGTVAVLIRLVTRLFVLRAPGLDDLFIGIGLVSLPESCWDLITIEIILTFLALLYCGNDPHLRTNEIRLGQRLQLCRGDKSRAPPRILQNYVCPHSGIHHHLLLRQSLYRLVLPEIITKEDLPPRNLVLNHLQRPGSLDYGSPSCLWLQTYQLLLGYFYRRRKVHRAAEALYCQRCTQCLP